MTDAINAADGNSINQTDYLKLFMQELNYQDPMKPVDNREFMAQMAQFSMLQEQRAANESLTALAKMTGASQSLMLLGKKVKVVNEQQSGLVTSIRFSSNAPPVINVDIDKVNMEKNINDITEVMS